MNRYCNAMWLLMIFLLAGAVSVKAQDLKGDWEAIQQDFLAGRHDSVVAHIPRFIDQLEQRSLWPQLSVAYFHYAVSLAYRGEESQSDSAFQRARSIAEQAGLPEKVKEIELKQGQLYMSLGKVAEQASPEFSIRQYTKALRTLKNIDEAKTNALLLFQRGLLYRSKGDTIAAIQDFESALPFAERAGEQGIQSSLVSLLTEMYVSRGQSEQARKLAGVGVDRSRMEFAIKLSAEAESTGDWKRADDLLYSIQGDMFASTEDERITEFIKKRFSLWQMQGNLGVALDTLKSIEQAGRSCSPFVQFQIQRLIALVYVQQGDITEAGNIVDRMARDVSGRDMSDRHQAQLDQTLADVAYLRGDHEGAITHYKGALESSFHFDHQTRLSMMNNLGLALARNGQDTEAIGVFDRMHAAAGERNLAELMIQSDLNGGIVLIKMDRVKEATDRFKRAKEAAERTQDLSLNIMASLRLAESYRRGGYDTFADEMFEEVRTQQERLTNPLARIQVLQALATNAKTGGNKYTALLNLRQAYDLAVHVGAEGYRGPLAIDLGDTYFLIDSLAAARSMYKTALSLYAGTKDLRLVVEQHFKLGQCYLAESEFSSARREVEQGLSQLVVGENPDYSAIEFSGIRDKDLFGQGLANLAFIDFTEGRERGDVRKLLKSLAEIQRSVEVFESKKGLGVAQTQRESESLKNVNAYRLLVDVASYLYEVTKDPVYFGLAFDTSEKSRAEAFVTDVGTQLIAKINDPKLNTLSEVASQIAPHQVIDNPVLGIDLSESAQLSRALAARETRGDEKALSQYDRIVKQLSAENNKAAQLVTVNTMTLNSVRGLLEEGEVLLDYYVSIDKVYLFLVATDGIMMRTIRWTPEELAGKVEAYRSAIHDLRRDDYAVFGQELYDSLIAPVRLRLEGKKIIIVPSFRLNNLPFAGLSNNGVFLVDQYNMTVIPNVSTLQFVRTEKHLSQSPRVLALGNPDNPRVTRLPGTEQEVNSIRSIYQSSVVYTGQEASETNSKNHMSGFDIIHIACHGLFNLDYPLLSSLVLSPDRENDGFLEVHELYNLNLTKTSLVILSACETGLSRIRKNDDVIGLVRGFLYSGVPSMVASLWKVDDNATASLMSNFHLLLKLGNSKSEALRKAQMQIKRDSATRHPFFWAAFVLYGSAN